jgi:hydrogenase maturation protease
MTATVVIGLGNVLMRDEGVGVHVVRRLAGRASRYPGVEFLDAGTSAMRVLHALAGRRRAVVVDCAYMGAAPGEVRRFTPDEARSVKRLGGVSAHAADLWETLRLSRRLGECPAEVVICGIEPAEVAPGERLSGPLSRRLEEYEARVAAEIEAEAARAGDEREGCHGSQVQRR